MEYDRYQNVIIGSGEGGKYLAWYLAESGQRTGDSLAPLSFRGATYSGVFTLLPLITGGNRAHHGEILARAASLAEAGALKPFLSEERFPVSNLEGAFARAEGGSLGKVVVEINTRCRHNS